jgi:hypothetical protein
MFKLLHELLKGNELTITPLRVTAKGALAVLLAYLTATMVFLYLVLS